MVNIFTFGFWNFLIIYEKVEPRAGFDPAACCLRGSRSTRLSHRGTLLAIL